MVHPISLAPRSTAIFRRERARSTVRHCISLCGIWALAERASTGGQWDFSFSTNYFYRLCRLHSFSDLHEVSEMEHRYALASPDSPVCVCVCLSLSLALIFVRVRALHSVNLNQRGQ